MTRDCPSICPETPRLPSLDLWIYGFMDLLIYGFMYLLIYVFIDYTLGMYLIDFSHTIKY